MRSRITAAALLTALTFCVPAYAQTGGAVVATAPGKGAVAQSIKMTATITAIDKASRDVTLKGPQGNEVVVACGPEVKNFDQMKVGDKVDIEYVEALALELKKGGGLPVARTETGAGGAAKPGDKPGAAAGRKLTVVADVVAVDPARQMVTLKGPQRTVELRVPDPDQFKLIAKGDQVEATYTQAAAIKVSAAPK